jgi:hypothetical protein
MEDVSVDQTVRRPLSRYDSVFEWDDLEPEPLQREDRDIYEPRSFLPSRRTAQSPRINPPIPVPETHRAHEKTPLLRKTVSFSNAVGQSRDAATANNTVFRHTSLSPRPLFHPPPIRRRSSSGSARTLQYNYGGKSTFGQTVILFLLLFSPRTRTYSINAIALQFNSHPTWNWYAFRTTCLCLFWLDWRHASNCILWIFNLLYVRFNRCRTNHPRTDVVLTQCKNLITNHSVGSAVKFLL